MTQNCLCKVVPAVLTIALAACQDPITGIVDPLMEAEAETSVATVHMAVSLDHVFSWWSADGNYDDVAPATDGHTANNVRWISNALGVGVRTLDLTDGTVGFETGFVGQAFRFTGAPGGLNQFLEIRTADDLRAPETTVELWAQRLGDGQNPSDAVLIQKAIEDTKFEAPGISYFISWRGTGSARRIEADVAFASDAEPITNFAMGRLVSEPVGNDEWVHVALTVDSNGDAVLYVNGVASSNTINGGGPPVYGNGSVVIGNNWQWARTTTQFGGPFKKGFNGCIDEIRIRGRALSATEIAAIYSSGDGSTCAPSAPEPVNTPPAVDAGEDAAINEGANFASTGSFTDPDADSWTATVDYDDGSGPERLTLLADKAFSLSHVYADNGTYQVTVTVDDQVADPVWATASVVVNNVAPTINSGPDEATVFAGNTYLSTVSFTDPGDDSWDVTVDYGDGTEEEFEVSATSFDLSHVYTSEQCGPFAVTVTVTDDDGAGDSSTAQVTVEYEYELSVNKTRVRLDRRRRHRSNRDRYDVDGRVPSSVLDCFNSETDELTVSFGGIPQDFPAGSFVRKDDKWQYKAPRGARGIRKFDLRDDGRFKIQARYMDLASIHFPGYVSFSLSIGPASGETDIQLDRRGRLHRPRARARGRDRLRDLLARWRKH